MNSKQLLKKWANLCIRKNTTPVCLITVSEDGVPHVFTNHDGETITEIFKHLSKGAEKSLVHFGDQEN